MKVRPGPHVAQLLTTFLHREKYHMIFRWADGGDLANLFRTTRPSKTYEQMCWIAEQCYGLADALNGVHDTSSRSTVGAVSELDQPLGENPRSEHGNPYYGRHGDLKPENILWFATDPNRFGRGVLKISDFGLATFHKDATTTMSPKGIPFSHTYCAPELELGENISRSYDVWSLGCVFLEFVTWVLLGPDGLAEFTQKRLDEIGFRPKWKIDNFFKVAKDDRGQHAEVKLSVTQVSDTTKMSELCSKLTI